MTQSDEKRDSLRIDKIKNGTVIDHIPANTALKVLRILGLPGTHDAVISIGMNVKSKRLQNNKKDIIKIENLHLDEQLMNKIALIAPNATIVRIREMQIDEKFTVQLPDEVYGIVECPNNRCISNTAEPVKTHFKVIDRKPLIKIQCEYCDRILFEKEISKYTL